MTAGLLVPQRSPAVREFRPLLEMPVVVRLFGPFELTTFCVRLRRSSDAKSTASPAALSPQGIRRSASRAKYAVAEHEGPANADPSLTTNRR